MSAQSGAADGGFLTGTRSSLFISTCHCAIRWWAGTGSHVCILGAVRVNEADAFADEDGANDEYFDFEDINGMIFYSLSSPI